MSDAVVLKTGHILMVNSEYACAFNPLLTTEPVMVRMPPLPKGIRTGKIEAATDSVIVSTTDGELTCSREL